MKKITMILFAGLATLFFTACGSSGGSSSGLETTTPVELDNSQLAEGENQFGFFGEEVMFGDHKIVGKWTYTFTSPVMTRLPESRGSFEFQADGVLIHDLFMDDDSSPPTRQDYGVGNDKDLFTYSSNANYYLIETINPSCYEVQWVANGQIQTEGSFCKL